MYKLSNAHKFSVVPKVYTYFNFPGKGKILKLHDMSKYRSLFDVIQHPPQGQ
jgi:hypothetical protein